jgi:hypothetical protein
MSLLQRRALFYEPTQAVALLLHRRHLPAPQQS